MKTEIKFGKLTGKKAVMFYIIVFTFSFLYFIPYPQPSILKDVLRGNRVGGTVAENSITSSSAFANAYHQVGLLSVFFICGVYLISYRMLEGADIR